MGAQRLIDLGFEGYRGWGDVEAEADFKATGGAGKAGGGGAGTAGAGTIQGNYEADLARSYEKLKPYYTKMLELANGDVNLAKRMIEADYAAGKRETEEESAIRRRELALQTKAIQDKYGYGVKEQQEEYIIKQRLSELSQKRLSTEYGLNKQEKEEEAVIKTRLTDLTQKKLNVEYELGMAEAGGTYQAAAREQALIFPQEQEQLATGLNRRGLAGGWTPGQIQGGLAATEAGRLQESQAIRKEAIDRALREKSLKLTKAKELGTEEVGITKESDIQKLNRALERLAQGYELSSAELGIQSEADAQRLARALEELRSAKETGLGEVGIAETANEERLARTLVELGQKKAFGTEKEELELQKTTQELGMAHTTQAGQLTGEELARQQSMESLKLAQEQAAEQKRLGDISKRLMQKQLGEA